jgi:acyl-CoA reductase-like NAD-dependent aldehyde dehydrogenase
VVCKPSEFTSASTLELARLAVEEAGLPPGVFNVVTGTGLEVGAPLVDHPGVQKIAFTGSVRTGTEIGIAAGKRIIPVTLELGGKSANIVFEDADLEKAAAGVVLGFTSNTGQACIAGTRCLVQASIYERFVEMIRERAAAVRIERDEPNGLGPIITKAQFDKVQDYFGVAEGEGAQALLGGTVEADKKGWYVSPTIYTGVTNDMRIAREEIFGPVLSVLTFGTEDEAITIANDSDYALGAGLWTSNLSRAHRVTAAALGLCAGAASADDMNIGYAAYGGPSSTNVRAAIVPFLETIKARTDGAIDYTLHSGGSIAGASATLGVVTDGTVDGAEILTIANQPKLPRSSLVVGLGPSVTADPIALAAAFTEYMLIGCPECRAEYESQNVVFLGGFATTG